jgi:hypothetical protein
MITVEFLQSIVGDGFSYRSGDVTAVPTAFATEWLALGYCRAIGEKAVEKKERATYTKREKR